MSKAFQLQIPKPCHENWDKMTQIEKGKYCSSCQKQVIDFTGMGDRELAAFFKKPSQGSVCGRFNNDQLNKDLEIPKKRIPWLKYFFTIALPAFIASSKAVAQGQVTKIAKEDTITKREKRVITLGNALPVTKCIKADPKKAVKGIDEPTVIVQGDVIPQRIIAEKKITGKVIDEKGTPLATASLFIKGTNHGTMTDAQGQFKMKTITPDSIFTLDISCVGYQTKEIQVANYSKEVIIQLNDLDLALAGEVIVVRKPTKKASIPLVGRVFKNTLIKNFKFYPNPVAPGSNIIIEWKNPESGDFEIQLFNQDGLVMNRKTESLVEKINSIQYPLPAVASGNYFLVLVNRKTGKRVTGKIIVQ